MPPRELADQDAGTAYPARALDRLAEILEACRLHHHIDISGYPFLPKSVKVQTLALDKKRANVVPLCERLNPCGGELYGFIEPQERCRVGCTLRWHAPNNSHTIVGVRVPSAVTYEAGLPKTETIPLAGGGNLVKTYTYSGGLPVSCEWVYPDATYIETFTYAAGMPTGSTFAGA